MSYGTEHSGISEVPALCCFQALTQLLKFLLVGLVGWLVFYLNNLSGCEDVPQRCAGGDSGAWECCGTTCT